MAFWLVTAAMAALAVGVVVVPLLRARAAAAPSETEANLEVLRGQRREIEADIVAGVLPADARDEALAELMGRASEDLSSPPPALASSREKPWPVVAAVALFVPLLAFGIYRAVGSPEAIEASALAAAGSAADAKQVVNMVETLAAKMKDRPDDAKGWALLARSMASLERFQESADAYARLVKLVPPDAQLLADYADVLAMAQGRKLAGRPTELIHEALRLDPNNQKALALAGTAAADAGDVGGAVRHWEKLLAQLPPGSEDAAQVQQIIDEIRAPPRAAASAPAAPAPRRGTPVNSVSGSVALAPDVAAKLSGSETVFILARAEGGGPRAPLAVIRTTARELPVRFDLDDSQAMAAGMNISSAEAIRVEARVSRSGEAMPRSGDFVGKSAVVKPGARDVAVLVDKVVP